MPNGSHGGALDGALIPDARLEGGPTEDAVQATDASADLPSEDAAPAMDVMDVMVCDAGLQNCHGTCVSTQSDPENCGVCGRVCPGVINGHATCVMGSCGFECNAGFHACGANCLDDTSPLSCGSACTPCPAPAGAHATCTMGSCGWECNPGYERVGAGCELRVLRPIAPLSTSTVSSQQPTFRWELAPGTDGASIEICRDRAFTVMCQTVDAMGTSARPASALTRGVRFWRLRGRSGGTVGTRTGPVWEFTVGARSAPRDTSWGTVLDVNGDGYADHAWVRPS